MTNITDIRNDLVAVFNGLVAGTKDSKDAMEINNTAGKIIGSLKVQLVYHALRKESPTIPFLETPELKSSVLEGEVDKRLNRS